MMIPETRPRRCGLIGLILLSLSVQAQQPADSALLRSLVSVPVLGATTVPTIDGNLNEAVWHRAPAASNFVQLEPNQGLPATEPTEVRVLYGVEALYIAIRAFDSDPGAIQAQLTRRDRDSFSDWVRVAIDSYDDNRTAFEFGVNPKGVKQDSFLYNDTKHDSDWDAVWDVAASVDEDGWTAEFRIPYSQLRFVRADRQTWGIQFTRWTARKNETSYWAPMAGDDNARVSKFGELRGLDGVAPGQRLEVTPYALGRMQAAPGDSANPFYKEQDATNSMGIDVKYGLTSNLTVDLTVNPDFGQVEADAAEVNLTEFETFFPERRAFFLEGSNIFTFGIGKGGELFHSRRIGRTPQGRADPRGGYVSAPDNTPIRAAMKLSGKTQSGWTIGTLYARTDRQDARISSGTGELFSEMVEPATHYGMTRLQKDFREGRSVLGVVATGVKRTKDDADALEIHTDAVSGGVDFLHRFWGDDYRIRGYVLGSRVTGGTDAIARTQRAASRYMQRPDADHVEFDPTRTSLTGTAARFDFGKTSGGFWRYGIGAQSRTPEFETNDIGFLNQADSLKMSSWVGYDQYLPTKHLRNWRLFVNTERSQTHGGERTGLSTDVNAKFRFHNDWTGSSSISFKKGARSPTMLRGGPSIRTDDSFAMSAGLATDDRGQVQLNVDSNLSHRPESDTWSFSISPTIYWRPSSRLQMSVGASYAESTDATQWVTQFTADETNEDHYVFGRISQQTMALTGRVDFSFTRDLTLEIYLQPFASAGRYDQFKRVADRNAAILTHRFQDLDTRPVEGGYLTDVDGNGNSDLIVNPDFNVRQFRSNAVLRWEYRPGSTLFAVWSQGRQDLSPDGAFNLEEDIRDLFDAPTDDVFMIKFSYWLNPTGVRGVRKG